VKISKGVINDDLMTAGQTVRVDAEVDGDLAAAGSQVTIAGPVDGYVMSAGRTVTLDGRIGNDLWAAGETVRVGGPIENNAFVAGRTVHFEPDASVGRDARLAGNTVRAEGRVERNLTIGAGTAQIGAEVGGDVDAHAARVSVLPGAVIHGDLDVTAAQPPDISPQAKIVGHVRYEKLQQRAGWLAWPLPWLLWFAALLVMGIAAMALLPGWTARVAAMLRTHVGRSFLTGFIGLVLIPIAIGVLAVTIVGIPLAIVLLAVYVALLLLSGVFVSYRVGEWLLARAHRAQASRWMRIVLGALVVSLGMTLPGVGWIVGIIVVMAGMGALALERRDARTTAPATA
jgi:cytoskeletal protein CcmA (bactofilin family)